MPVVVALFQALPADAPATLQLTVAAVLIGEATVLPALVVCRLIWLTRALPIAAVRFAGLALVVLVMLLLFASCAVIATVFTPPQTGMDASVVPPFMHDKVPSMKLGVPDDTLIEDDREFAAPLTAKLVGAPLATVNDHDGHLSSLAVLALPLVIAFPYVSQNHA